MITIYLTTVFMQRLLNFRVRNGLRKIHTLARRASIGARCYASSKSGARQDIQGSAGRSFRLIWNGVGLGLFTRPRRRAASTSNGFTRILLLTATFISTMAT